MAARPAGAQPAAGAERGPAALEAAMEALGPFGLYQRYTLALLCVPSALAALCSLSYVFSAAPLPFRCAVAECEGAGADFANGTLWALLPRAACRRYVPLAGAACERAHYHAALTQPCDAFVYSSQRTIYAEFGLACRERRRALAGSVRRAALPLSLLLAGYVSDAFGRRAALCVFSACAGVLGLVKSFSPNYPMFLAAEFLGAALGSGFDSAAYVLMLELARPAQRAACAGAAGAARGLGGAALALLAARARDWRRLLRAAHAPALLLPLYGLLLAESWRWQHARGRRRAAAGALRRAARWNKVRLEPALLARVEAADEAAPGAPAAASAWLGVLRSRALLARFAACAWCWAAAALASYGLTGSGVSLSADRYVDFALGMGVEVAASPLLVMALERCGRRRTIGGAFLACGLACVAPYFAGGRAARALLLAGKLAVSLAFNALYVFSAELFPTPVRCSALAACSLAGGLGSALAPQTPLLGAGAQAALYGASSALAAAAVALVPETRRAPLPADAAAAERLRAPPAPAAPAEPAPAAPRVLSASDP